MKKTAQQACVARLISNDKFKYRRKGMSKEQAAERVCSIALNKQASDEYDENVHKDQIDEINFMFSQPMMTFNRIRVAKDEEKTIPTEFEIVREGEWDHPWYGKFQVTKSIIKDFIKSHNARITAKGTDLEDNDLPVNLNHERGGPAAGWVKKMTYREDEGVGVAVATVEWTELGEEQIRKDLYRYISPEWSFEYEDPETREVTQNVIVGAALTNIPYFKVLKPLTMSEDAYILFSNTSPDDNMKYDLAKLILKEASELDAGEIEFMKANQEEMTVKDFKKFEAVLKADEEEEEETKEEETKEEETKKATEEGTVTISKAEYEATQQTADRVTQLEAKIEEQELEKFTSEVGAKLTPAAKKELTKVAKAMTPEQRKDLKAFVDALPDSKAFKEMGSGEKPDNQASDDSDKTLAAEARKIAKEKGIKFREALKIAKEQNPELVAK